MFKPFSQVFKILRNLPTFLGVFGVAQIYFSSLDIYILSHLVYFITIFIKFSIFLFNNKVFILKISILQKAINILAVGICYNFKTKEHE